MEMKGQFQGDVLTLTGKGPQGHNRAVFDLRERDTYAFRMEVSQDGAKGHTFMDGKYARQR